MIIIPHSEINSVKTSKMLHHVHTMVEKYYIHNRFIERRAIWSENVDREKVC